MSNSTALYLMYGAYGLAAVAMVAAAFLREGLAGNVMLYGAVAIVGVLMGLLALIQLFMPGPRVVVFFGTFMGLVVLPWVVGYVTLGPAIFASRTTQPAAQPAAAAATTAQGATVADITAGLEGARRAQVAMHPGGGTTHETHFADQATASRYVERQFGAIRKPSVVIAGREGVLLSETPAIFVRSEGASVWIYQAPQRSMLESMMQSAATLPSLTAQPPAASVIARDPLVERMGLGPLLSGLLIYVLFVSWVFLRLTTWAAVQEAEPGVQPLPAVTLRERLLALNQLDVPFSVKPGARPDELVAEWRYADARWIDHARAHHMRYVIRYTLRLDETEHTVRVFEYRAETNASAGVDGASLKFHMSRGITFFEVRRETVLGLQFRDGRPTTDLAYTWRFNLEEIRGPLRATANRNGWRWKQLMLDLPWLTG
jgi:hypothetical protein